jgi:hypothetical protein
VYYFNNEFEVFVGLFRVPCFLGAFLLLCRCAFATANTARILRTEHVHVCVDFSLRESWCLSILSVAGNCIGKNNISSSQPLYAFSNCKLLRQAHYCCITARSSWAPLLFLGANCSDQESIDLRLPHAIEIRLYLDKLQTR